jgi:hypothetical protein
MGMRKFAAFALTLAGIVAYGLLLKWAHDNGLWYVIVTCFALTAWAGYRMSSPAERASFSADIRRLIGRQ